MDFVKLVRDSETSPSSQDRKLSAPSFDHKLKDPTLDAIDILPSHRIVLFEGLYALLSTNPWQQAAKEMDERWIIDVDREMARSRLVKRHVLTGVTENEMEAIHRGILEIQVVADRTSS